MRQRGRDSETKRAAGAPVIELHPQPQPPADLNEAEAAIWRSLVASMPASWFRPETHAMLETLCRVTVQLHQINKQFARFGSELPRAAKQWQRYKELTALRGRLASQVSLLSTKLRLTPQSRINPLSAARRVTRHVDQPPLMPWHDDGPPAA
jgi:hypothetical protein